MRGLRRNPTTFTTCKSKSHWANEHSRNKSIKINNEKWVSLFFLFSPFSQLILANSSRRNSESALSMPIRHKFPTHTELRNLVDRAGSGGAKKLMPVDWWQILWTSIEWSKRNIHEIISGATTGNEKRKIWIYGAKSWIYVYEKTRRWQESRPYWEWQYK